MAWSYGPAEGSAVSGERDVVRLLIGDTNPDFPLLQDEEIDVFLGLGIGTYSAAVAACRSLAAQFSSVGTIQIGDKRLQAGDIATRFQELAGQLDSSAASLAPVGPEIMGTTYTELRLDRHNPDLVRLPVSWVGSWVTPWFGDQEEYLP